MRLFKTLATTLVALTLLAGFSVPATAQDDAPLQLEDLDGIQQAVSRSFFVDATSMTEAATPAASQDAWFGLITMVMSFDSDTDAAQALPRLSEDLLRSDFAGDDGTSEEVQLDIESTHEAYLFSTREGDMPATILVVIAQHGSSIDIVMGATQGADPEAVVTATLTEMAEKPAGDGEGTFSPDGTSRGGLWDRLPNAEAVSAEIPGPITVADELLYPEPSGERASTPDYEVVPVTEATPAG